MSFESTEKAFPVILYPEGFYLLCVLLFVLFFLLFFLFFLISFLLPDRKQKI